MKTMLALVLSATALSAQVPSNVTVASVNLDFGNGEFGVLAHLRHTSVIVKAGDRVVTGQEIGRCGNSGNTSEPHLHFHVQTAETFEIG